MTLEDDLSAWDKVIQSPVRFTLMSVLSKADSVNFGELRQAMRVTASSLSKQVTLLEDAGYVNVEKIVRGRRVLTEVSITQQGLKAYQSQLDLLKRLTAGNI